jgi:hypothetical protein
MNPVLANDVVRHSGRQSHFKLSLFILLILLFVFLIGVQTVNAGTAINRSAAIAFASGQITNPSSASQGGNARNGLGYSNVGRWCASYLALTMRAGGIPISASTQGNDQIFAFLSGNRNGTGSASTIDQLANYIRTSPYVAGVSVNSMPLSVKPGDLVFFNLQVIGPFWNRRWGAQHSAIITNQLQSPIRVAYWNVERYGVAFNDVLRQIPGNYMVIRFY